MTTQPTMTPMVREIAEVPDAVARLLDREAPAIREFGHRIASRGPAVPVACARGSSDNAAGFGKYLIEIQTGIPVASISPSVASIYAAPLRLRRSFGRMTCLPIRPSGEQNHATKRRAICKISIFTD